jgi:hypothetical protein
MSILHIEIREDEKTRFENNMCGWSRREWSSRQGDERKPTEACS